MSELERRERWSEEQMERDRVRERERAKMTKIETNRYRRTIKRESILGARDLDVEQRKQKRDAEHRLNRNIYRRQRE